MIDRFNYRSVRENRKNVFLQSFYSFITVLIVLLQSIRSLRTPLFINHIKLLIH